MTQFDNTNKGQLWGNEKKETDKHPDFKGSINVEGVEYWLSAWKRDSGGNPKAPALRFSIQRKEDVHNAGMAQAQAAIPQQQPQPQAPQAGDFDDDIPF